MKLAQLQSTKKSFAYGTSPVFPQKMKDLQESMAEQSQVFKSIHQCQLPTASGYLILQLSPNMQHLYVGFCKNVEDNIEYFNTKLTLSEFMLSKLRELIDRVQSFKNFMFKTPITIQEDLEEMEKEGNIELQEIIKELEVFFEPITVELNKFINVAPAEPEEEEGKKDDKKGGKDAKGAAKGGKDDLPKYESNLPLPNGGIESLILLPDTRLSELPLEALSVLKDIPVLSRDFSLSQYLTRLERVGHKADLHNNQGIAKDKLKFVYDPPSTQKD